MNRKVLDDKGIKVDEALEFWGDLETYQENLKEYQDELKDKLNNLEYYKNSNDCDNYAILVHSMKSEAKYLGFMNEAEIFLEHELKSKDGDINYINNNFNKIIDTVNNINNLITEALKVNTKPNILVADDSKIILNILDNNLKDNYNVLKAENGNEAVDTIKNNKLYAIFLDLNMPVQDGFYVLDYLKESNLFQDIPVVIISGDDTEETIKKAFTYPILDMLNKPFKIENIERILVSINSFYENK